MNYVERWSGEGSKIVLDENIQVADFVKIIDFLSRPQQEKPVVQMENRKRKEALCSWSNDRLGVVRLSRRLRECTQEAIHSFATGGIFQRC